MKKLTPYELRKETERSIKRAYITAALVFAGVILVALALYFSLKALLVHGSAIDTAIAGKAFGFWFWQHRIIILGPFVIMGMAVFAVRCFDVKRLWAIGAAVLLCGSLGYATHEYAKLYKDVSREDCVVYEGEYAFFREAFSIKHNRGDSVRLTEDGDKHLYAVDDFLDTGNYEGTVTYLRESGYVIDVTVDKVSE